MGNNFIVYIKCNKKGKEINPCPNIRWWNLKRENVIDFRYKLSKRGNMEFKNWTKQNVRPNGQCMKRVAKDVLGETKDKRYTHKKTWLWNNKIQETIKKKMDWF